MPLHDSKKSPPNSDAASELQLSRRRALMLGAAAATAAGLAPAVAQAQGKIKTQARIVIAGGGAAGLTAASRLSAALEGARIIMIDARKEHYYQPGFTLVGAGIKPRDYVVSTTGEYVPSGVEWIQASVAEIDPDGNKVVTDAGQAIPYDYLIVATGMRLNYQEIEGMDTALIGKEGIGSIYNGPDGAAATWKALSEFTDKGGRGVFLRPATEMKCAGAPLKYMWCMVPITPPTE